LIYEWQCSAQHGACGVVRLNSVARGCPAAEVMQRSGPIMAALTLSSEWFRSGKGKVREQCGMRVRVNQGGFQVSTCKRGGRNLSKALAHPIEAHQQKPWSRLRWSHIWRFAYDLSLFLGGGLRSSLSLRIAFSCCSRLPWLCLFTITITIGR
jgi:hypothetical protein